MKTIAHFALVASLLIPNICMGSGEEEELVDNKKHSFPEHFVKKAKEFEDRHKRNMSILDKAENKEKIGQALLDYFEEENRHKILTVVLGGVTFFCRPPALTNEPTENLQKVYRIEEEKELQELEREVRSKLQKGKIQISDGRGSTDENYPRTLRGWIDPSEKVSFFFEQWVIDVPICAIKMSVLGSDGVFGLDEDLYKISLVPEGQMIEKIPMSREFLSFLYDFKKSLLSFPVKNLLRGLKSGEKQFVSDKQYRLKYFISDVKMGAFCVDLPPFEEKDPDNCQGRLASWFKDFQLGNGAEITDTTWESKNYFDGGRFTVPIIKTLTPVSDLEGHFKFSVGSETEQGLCRIGLVPHEKQEVIDVWKSLWFRTHLSPQAKDDATERFQYVLDTCCMKDFDVQEFGQEGRTGFIKLLIASEREMRKVSK